MEKVKIPRNGKKEPEEVPNLWINDEGYYFYENKHSERNNNLKSLIDRIEPLNSFQKEQIIQEFKSS